MADDHDLVRDTLASFLTREGVGEVQTAGSLDEALRVVKDTGSFDVVLLDYDMPGMEGLDGLARMIPANCSRPVALMSGTVSPDIANKALKSGAAGFVPKTLASRALVSALRFMAVGEVFVPFEFLNRVNAPPVEGLLSQRETEVLRCLCSGKSNKEIALDLELQEVTVKFHVKTLSRKLGARNRTHAAMLGRDRKLT